GVCGIVRTVQDGVPDDLLECRKRVIRMFDLGGLSDKITCCRNVSLYYIIQFTEYVRDFTRDLLLIFYRIGYFGSIKSQELNICAWNERTRVEATNENTQYRREGIRWWRNKSQRCKPSITGAVVCFQFFPFYRRRHIFIGEPIDV